MNNKKNKRIILIANNQRITPETIDSINILPEDLIILFNLPIPIRFTKIQEHLNKIVFIRLTAENKLAPNWDVKKTGSYIGLNFVVKYKELFKNILPCDGEIQGINFHSKVLDKLLFEKKIDEEFISKIDYNYDSYVKSYMNSLEKCDEKPTTGFIGYCYAQKIKNKEDKVLLVGFDLLFGGRITKGFHNGFYELNQYEEEEKKGNIIKIPAALIDNLSNDH